MRKPLMAACLVMVVLIAACQPRQNPLPEAPTQTPSPSPAPSATIVWFPPTPTYTPLPSVTLNPEVTSISSPSYGDLIFQDDFMQAELWTAGKMSAGNIAFGDREISLGVSQPKGYLYSIRKDSILEDFYLEITASPSICRQKDEYGVIFHSASTQDFFRFGLNCSGETRLDRLVNGTASAPQSLIRHGAIPPGAPSVSRLGIRVIDTEMQFYANGELLFTVHDPSLPSGGLGVYARSAGEDPMTVNFSNLAVYQAVP